jgi:hypothetical protein
VKRVPQTTAAWVVPDVAGVDVWAELAEASRAGLPVVLSPGHAKQLLAARDELAAKAFEFKPDGGE